MAQNSQNADDAQFTTGDVVEFDHRGERARGIVKWAGGKTGDERTYTVAVPKDTGNKSYVYKNESNLNRRGEVEFDPQDPFEDSVEELIAPFRTVEVECNNCGDEFHVSEAAMTYGKPRYCSEACGINAGAIERNRR